MTTAQIEARQARVNIKFELAKQIRKLLDDARKSYGAQAWTDDDIEAEVLELVGEDS